MFYIMSGKYYIGGYSPVYDILTFTGKTQAKVFKTEQDAVKFLEHYINYIPTTPKIVKGN